MRVSGSSYVFETTDWAGHVVRLTRRTFDSHAPKRRDFSEGLADAQRTIEDPDIIAEADNGAISLFRFGLGRHPRLYRQVIIHYEGAPPIGYVATHLTTTLDDVTIIEQRYWWIGGSRLKFSAVGEQT